MDNVVRINTSYVGGGDEPPLQSGDGGGTYSNMETRVGILEYRADQVEKRFDRIDAKLDAIGRDIAEVKGRVNTLPGTWQLIGVFGAMMALLLGGAGIVLALLRYVGG